MLLNKLIDALTAIEARNPGELTEVEIFDAEGYRTGEFSVVTEIVLHSTRRTVLLGKELFTKGDHK